MLNSIFTALLMSLKNFAGIIYANVIKPTTELITDFWRVLVVSCILLRNFILFFLPFSIFLCVTLVFAYILKADFKNYLELLKVLVWPTTLLLTLFFFRKVVTYLFFSMSEFNFFGSKGVLKSVTDVIEERVEARFQNEKEQKRQSEELAMMEKELAQAVKSGKNHEERATDNLKLAREVLENYKQLSDKYNVVKSELDAYRDREQERLDRIEKMKERAIERRAKMGLDNPSPGQKVNLNETAEQPKRTNFTNGAKITE